MHWFRTALGLLRAKTTKPRPVRATRKRWGFESLETREVFSGNPFLASTPTASPAPVLNLVDNTLNAARALTYAPNQIHIAIYGQDYDTQKWYYLDGSGTPHLTTTRRPAATFRRSC